VTKKRAVVGGPPGEVGRIAARIRESERRGEKDHLLISATTKKREETSASLKNKKTGRLSPPGNSGKGGKEFRHNSSVAAHQENERGGARGGTNEKGGQKRAR